MARARPNWSDTASRVIVAAFITLAMASQGLCNPPPSEGADASKVFPPSSFLTQRETWAALAVLIFGLALGSIAMLIMRQRTLPTGEVIRVTAMILIVTGTLFLVTAGYSAEQIAPALGLLGTVAGYMLGRGDRNAAESGGGAKGADNANVKDP